MVRVGGAPRRAAAKRCAYHTEQKSLERTFETIDPATIAEVLASHSGNMELAAMDLVELDRVGVHGASGGASPDDTNTSGGSPGENTEKTATDPSFWNDVLGDVTMETDDEGEAGGVDTSGAVHVPATDGVTPYASWPADQWSTVETNVLGTLTENVNLAEKLVGWRISPGAETNAVTAGDDSIEILVKWKARALKHCSWVSLLTLAAALNLASPRLTKFWEKHPRAAGEAVAVPRECLEVCRVLALRDGDEALGYGDEALVKWGGGLGYDETTWESQAWVRTNAATATARHEEVLSRRARKVAAAAARVAAASPVSEEDHPPSREWYGSEGNVLRKYQREGVRWMAHNLLVAGRGCVLADEMGLGKTAQSLALIDYVLRSEAMTPEPTIKPRGPALVVVPLSTLVNWEREAARWAPGAHVVPYVGNPSARAMIRQHELMYDQTDMDGDVVYKADIVLTTYEMVQADRSTLSKVPWSCLVVDEAHRLKNSEGRAVRDLNSLDFAGRVVLLTGTPLQNDTAELWSLLNFVDGRRFADKEDFESKFGAVKGAGQVEALHKVLAPYLLRRLKQDVEHKLPPRVETLIECELMPLQKKCYRALFERNFKFLRHGCNDDRALANFNNVMMEVRKCCQHPFLLDGVEEAFVAQQALQKARARSTATITQLAGSSGKLQLLDKLLPRLKAGGHRVLIFSQMTRVLDVLEDYSRSRGHSYERLDGGVTGRARQAAIDRFCGPEDAPEQAPDGAFLFLLSTRAGGQGINLVAADTVIVFDSDWNPQNDAQALARAHRIGQTKPVQVYRLVMRGTYERDMLDRAAMKLGLEQAIFGGVRVGEKTAGGAGAGRAEIERLLKHGAYAAVAEDPDADTKATAWGAEGIDDILARSERRVVEASDNTDAETDPNANKSAFATATFAGARGGETDEIALDDPEFWEKLMPEAAAAERLREQEVAAEEATRLAEEKKADASGTRGRAVVEKREFQWSWAERKSVVDKLCVFGFGQWSAVHAASKLDDDKTPAHVAAFCRRYVITSARTLGTDACPFLLDAACSAAERDELAIPQNEGGKVTLNAVFAEALFTKHIVQRAHEEMSRLELMQPLINVVTNAGGHGAALAPDNGGWLTESCEVKNVETHCESPAPWWSSRDDRGLLVGTLRHGWGRWDAILKDTELGLEKSWEAAISAANGAAGTAGAADADAPSTARRSKRRRSGSIERANSASEGEGESSKENTPVNKHKRVKLADSPPGGVKSDGATENPSKQTQAVEWPLNRVLSLRVRRLCAALGGKLAVAPPSAKPPRVSKPKKAGGPGPKGPRAAAMGNMDKAERARLQNATLPRNNKGNVVLPVGPTQGVTLLCLGTVQPPDASGYHCAAYILPVGYRTARQYMRCDDPNGERTRYVQEITLGESGPEFKLTADHGLDEPIVAKSATAAWAEVLRRVTAARAALGEEPKKTAISGPEFFGYSLPHIRLLVEELPGVARCGEYQHLMQRQTKPAEESGEGDAMEVDAS